MNDDEKLPDGWMSPMPDGSAWDDLFLIALFVFGFGSIALMGSCSAEIERRDRAAIADTHPKDGDVKQAPLVSGGGSEGNRPKDTA